MTPGEHFGLWADDYDTLLSLSTVFASDWASHFTQQEGPFGTFYILTNSSERGAFNKFLEEDEELEEYGLTSFYYLYSTWRMNP